MLNGRDTLGIINQHIMNARTEIENAHEQLSELNERLSDIRGRTTERYRQLARFRLDELSADRLVSRLDEADRTLLQLLKQKGQALHDLQTQIEASVSRQSELAANREAQEDRRDEALEALENKLEQIKADLKQDEAYTVQEATATLAAAKAQKAEEKAAEAEDDRVEKGKPYEDDPLFIYLWKRRYLTPDYEAGRLIRSLDGWLAGLIEYEQARGNYHMLTELPLRLREHANRLRQIAEQETQALKSIEMKAAHIGGLPRLQATLEKEEEALHEIDDEIEVEETHHEDLLKQRADFSSFSDKYSQQAIELHLRQLKNEELTDLYRQAQATPKPDDDVIVGELKNLHKQDQQVMGKIKGIREAERRTHDAFVELESLRRRFRRSNYDSHHSNFPSGFDLAMLLGMLMQGKTTGGHVWERIDHQQQFRRPYGSKEFGGGLLDHGGFGSGGGFGGEGFRTGGRF